MNIFEELYMGKIEECARNVGVKNIKNYEKEYKMYEEIKSKLNEEDKVLMDDFLDVWQLNFDNELMDKYIQGLKTGILLGVGACDIDL